MLRAAGYAASLLWGQYGTRPGLRRRQLRALTAMLAHARRRVPYYRDHAAYRHTTLASAAELAELPLLEKRQLRDLPQRTFVADNVDPGRCVRMTTSGTTGQRLALLHDPAHEDRQNAAMVRRYLATGRYRPTHRLSHFRLLPSASWGVQRWGLFRRDVILTSEPAERWPDLVLRNRPHGIIGYPVHLRELLGALSAR
jgi:phenylacetate-CoA ligase